MEVASVLRSGHSASAARGTELAGQLRAAVMEGDDARLGRLLSELLRIKGLTKGQRVALQMRTLQNMVHALRAVALSDEATGLFNHRGFVQTATRLLDLAARDGQPAHLVYFRLGQVEAGDDSVGPSATELHLRQMGNFMRDLFPNYGVYEVLGRLGPHEFAALTPCAEHGSRAAIALRLRRHPQSGELPALPLSFGIAHFDPSRPVAIDELLESARQAMHADERVVRMASSELAPQPGMTLC